MAGELRQRQVPAESGRRCGRPARRGRPALPLPLGVGRSDQLAGRSGARASPPPAQGTEGTVAAAASDSILWRDAPGSAAALLLPEASSAARALRSCGESSSAPPPVRPRGQPHPSPRPFTCHGLPGGRARGENEPETGARETPFPGLHSALRRNARQHCEPLRSLHPVPKFKGDTRQERSSPAR